MKESESRLIKSSKSSVAKATPPGRVEALYEAGQQRLRSRTSGQEVSVLLFDCQSLCVIR